MAEYEAAILPNEYHPSVSTIWGEYGPPPPKPAHGRIRTDYSKFMMEYATYDRQNHPLPSHQTDRFPFGCGHHIVCADEQEVNTFLHPQFQDGCQNETSIIRRRGSSNRKKNVHFRQSRDVTYYPELYQAEKVHSESQTPSLLPQVICHAQTDSLSPETDPFRGKSENVHQSNNMIVASYDDGLLDDSGQVGSDHWRYQQSQINKAAGADRERHNQQFSSPFEEEHFKRNLEFNMQSSEKVDTMKGEWTVYQRYGEIEQEPSKCIDRQSSVKFSESKVVVSSNELKVSAIGPVYLINRNSAKRSSGTFISLIGRLPVDHSKRKDSKIVHCTFAKEAATPCTFSLFSFRHFLPTLSFSPFLSTSPFRHIPSRPIFPTLSFYLFLSTTSYRPIPSRIFLPTHSSYHFLSTFNLFLLSSPFQLFHCTFSSPIPLSDQILLASSFPLFLSNFSFPLPPYVLFILAASFPLYLSTFSFPRPSPDLFLLASSFYFFLTFLFHFLLASTFLLSLYFFHTTSTFRPIPSRLFLLLFSFYLFLSASFFLLIPSHLFVPTLSFYLFHFHLPTYSFSPVPTPFFLLSFPFRFLLPTYSFSLFVPFLLILSFRSPPFFTFSTSTFRPIPSRLFLLPFSFYLFLSASFFLLIPSHLFVPTLSFYFSFYSFSTSFYLPSFFLFLLTSSPLPFLLLSTFSFRLPPSDIFVIASSFPHFLSAFYFLLLSSDLFLLASSYHSSFISFPSHSLFPAYSISPLPTHSFFLSFPFHFFLPKLFLLASFLPLFPPTFSFSTSYFQPIHYRLFLRTLSLYLFLSTASFRPIHSRLFLRTLSFYLFLDTSSFQSISSRLFLHNLSFYLFLPLPPSDLFLLASSSLLLRSIFSFHFLLPSYSFSPLPSHLFFVSFPFHLRLLTCSICLFVPTVSFYIFHYTSFSRPVRSHVFVPTLSFYLFLSTSSFRPILSRLFLLILSFYLCLSTSSFQPIPSRLFLPTFSLYLFLSPSSFRPVSSHLFVPTVSFYLFLSTSSFRPIPSCVFLPTYSFYLFVSTFFFRPIPAILFLPTVSFYLFLSTSYFRPIPSDLSLPTPSLFLPFTSASVRFFSFSPLSPRFFFPTSISLKPVHFHFFLPPSFFLLFSFCLCFPISFPPLTSFFSPSRFCFLSSSITFFLIHRLLSKFFFSASLFPPLSFFFFLHSLFSYSPFRFYVHVSFFELFLFSSFLFCFYFPCYFLLLLLNACQLQLLSCISLISPSNYP
ncbi:unnamed protein product [Acanthosepion pharaonis]|uniref:Uncharacterized protein n=1 Tax=Acanthosepion pharaonis TaxID=158019 RepID=A0A812E2M9_ACAPH|nr:unnamed protein product [Sepia pharaonis]